MFTIIYNIQYSFTLHNTFLPNIKIVLSIQPTELHDLTFEIFPCDVNCPLNGNIQHKNKKVCYELL